MSEPCARCGQPIDIHANPITVDERHPLWGEPLCYDCANEYDYTDNTPELREILEVAEELSGVLTVVVELFKGPRKADDLHTEASVRLLIDHATEFQRLTQELLDYFVLGYDGIQD